MLNKIIVMVWKNHYHVKLNCHNIKIFQFCGGQKITIVFNKITVMVGKESLSYKTKPTSRWEKIIIKRTKSSSWSTEKNNNYTSIKIITIAGKIIITSNKIIIMVGNIIIISSKIFTFVIVIFFQMQKIFRWNKVLTWGIKKAAIIRFQRLFFTYSKSDKKNDSIF